ncbi:MAG: hypothetical protein O9339_20685 [Rubrivivax sp.]|nr:hypothetical protein [Rubrivivax sp.]
MTNEELAQAIEVADKKARECGTGQPRYEPLLAHLKALLAEQRRRAEQRPEWSGPLPAVQPVLVPVTLPAPTWAPRPPWEPPYTVTCGGAQ